MKIIDKNAFFENESVLKVDTMQGNSKQFVIALNFTVGVYYKMLCLFDSMNDATDNYTKYETAARLVTIILQTSDNDITAEWVFKNISYKNMLEIIYQIFTATEKLLDADYLQIPDLEVKKNYNAKDTAAKERQKKQDTIKDLMQKLSSRKNTQLMNDVCIVMTKTNNSYSDIMQMPILIFKNIVRTIIINENRVDEDYNIAYLKFECEKYKIELNEAEEKPAQKKGADLKKLKALLG